jgi:hypothetical protein
MEQLIGGAVQHLFEPHERQRQCAGYQGRRILATDAPQRAISRTVEISQSTRADIVDVYACGREIFPGSSPLVRVGSPLTSPGTSFSFTPISRGWRAIHKRFLNCLRHRLNASFGRGANYIVPI